MDRAALGLLVDLGLIEMKATGHWGLSAEGVQAASAFRLLDDFYAVQTGKRKTRRDLKLTLEERRQ